ncbi:hypothetical protein AYK26_06095 [Euryarchaeota archaeon SM23-78]|nr:MAG: hypothetical protein AYK26_06095 [Euryarchaeota archaeon SM23-78]
MKKLEKILGKENIRKIEEKAEYLLREAYKAEHNPVTESNYSIRGRIYINSSDFTETVAAEVLRSFGLLTGTGYGPYSYNITKKGKEVFDTHFRKPREFFSSIEEIRYLIEKRKKEKKASPAFEDL